MVQLYVNKNFSRSDYLDRLMAVAEGLDIL
jgi:hypothetical protein